MHFTVLILVSVLVSAGTLFRTGTLCNSHEKECNIPPVTGLGKLIWGECSKSEVLLRYDKLNLFECAKECLFTAQCTSINFRFKWKTCDLMSESLLDDGTRIQEPDCLSSDISKWDKSIAGQCAEHECKAGQKCKFENQTSGIQCYDAFCAENPPRISNSKINEKFGVYRNYDRGTKYTCTDGYSMRGSPFIICRRTNAWEVSFCCVKDDLIADRYIFSDTKENWLDAMHVCKTYCMTLASIQSSTENEFLFEKVTMKYNGQKIRQIWLGGKTSQSHGVFSWIALSGKEEPLTYKNFRQGEPNNHAGQENCLNFRYHDGTWNDELCERKLYYICEI